MIGQGLSLDQAPPISIPFRFFATAMVLSFLAALFLLFRSDHLLAARWSLDLYALTHLYTLGFLGSVMMGALFQMIPVTGGFPVPGTRVIAPILHIGFLAGLALLIHGFHTSRGDLIGMGGAILSVLLVFFAVYLIQLLVRKGRSKDGTNQGMIFSLLSLLGGVLLAFLMTASHTGILSLPGHLSFTKVHILFMLGGWITLLIGGVSFRVVPMFFITGEYPVLWKRFYPPAQFALLIVAGILEVQGRSFLFPVVLALPVFLLLIQGALTLRLIFGRKRKIADYTSRLFLLGEVFLFLAVAVFATGLFLDPGRVQESTFVFAGIPFLYGYAGSIVSGMLLKIIPFLSWFHLTALFVPGLPTMRDFIPFSTGRWIFIFRILIVIGLGLEALLEDFPVVVPATLAIIEPVFLLYGGGRAVLIYRKFRKNAPEMTFP